MPSKETTNLKRLKRLSVLAGFGIAFCACNSALAQNALIEPGAGNWKTFAISAGRDFRVPPPPDAAAARNEMALLKTLLADTDPRISQQIQFWDAGAPSYRWMDLIAKRQAAVIVRGAWEAVEVDFDRGHAMRAL